MKRFALSMFTMAAIVTQPALAHPGHSHWLDVHEVVIYDPSSASEWSSLIGGAAAITALMIVAYVGISILIRRKSSSQEV